MSDFSLSFAKVSMKVLLPRTERSSASELWAGLMSIMRANLLRLMGSVVRRINFYANLMNVKAKDMSSSSAKDPWNTNFSHQALKSGATWKIENAVLLKGAPPSHVAHDTILKHVQKASERE